MFFCSGKTLFCVIAEACQAALSTAKIINKSCSNKVNDKIASHEYQKQRPDCIVLFWQQRII